ncbi:MAG: hypothetical protein ACRC6D_08625 [Aeromonas sp.]
MNIKSPHQNAQPHQQPKQQPTPLSDFGAHYQTLLADFSAALESQRFWHISPRNGSHRSDGPCGLFDAKEGLKYPPLPQLAHLIKNHPFLLVQDSNSNTLATFETHSGLLWHWDGKIEEYSYEAALDNIKRYATPGLSGWRAPSNDELKTFATNTANPHRTDQQLHHLNTWFSNDRIHYLLDDSIHMQSTDREARTALDGVIGVTTHSIFNTDILSELRRLTDSYSVGAYGLRNRKRVTDHHSAHLYGCSSQWQGLPLPKLILELTSSHLRLTTPNGDQHFSCDADNSWQSLSPEALLRALFEADLCLKSVDSQQQLRSPISTLSSLDWTACRLPELEGPRLTDPNKGLWELWGTSQAELDQLGLVARDPARDVKLHNVAIDFGTSSTVVAYCDEHDAYQLLRIGVRDFYQAPEAGHYENPTVLEVLDYQRFIAIWQQQAYRPALDWDWLRASHEARESFRSNPGDTRVMASILPRIKQWAMRSEKERLRLTDYQGYETVLPALTERNPIAGEAMTVNEHYPFDPVELYAWYLGMAINWRERGLYLKYHMTFPAKYERATKDKILASFRRGLQRSLPTTLIQQSDILRQFEVRELASEPTAYAAAALAQLESSLGDDGIAYAVFDFGGGTTDFDFGLCRWATPEEEDEGYEQVFESLHSSGDNFLGGETLLEQLVYATFQDNLEVCRAHKIHFTRPLDGDRFAGDEAFVQPTQAAQTNTVMLAAELRAFMESDDGKLNAQLKIKLLDVSGQPRQCELSLDPTMLDALLNTRIRRGLQAFLCELAHVTEQFAGKTVHILLAGNGSRSRHLADLIEGNEWQTMLTKAFGATPPAIEIHPPLAIDEANHHAPTAKTGVALGLLRLCPGEGVKLIDRVRSAHHDEAPFRYYVGSVRRRQFDAKLTPTDNQEGWTLLGVMPQTVFKLCYSQSPRARGAMDAGDPELLTHRVDFPTAQPGSKVFVRAIAPSIITLAAAQDEAQLSDKMLATYTLDLDTGLMIR